MEASAYEIILQCVCIMNCDFWTSWYGHDAIRGLLSHYLISYKWQLDTHTHTHTNLYSWKSTSVILSQGLKLCTAIKNFERGNIFVECKRTMGSVHERCFWFDSVKSWSTGKRCVNFHTYNTNLPEYVLHTVYMPTSTNMVTRRIKIWCYVKF
jgi:hypothetical protein